MKMSDLKFSPTSRGYDTVPTEGSDGIEIADSELIPLVIDKAATFVTRHHEN